MASRDILNRFDPTKIDRIFASLDQCREPGAAVAIAIGGTPVYRRGFGVANMELPIMLGPGMRMRIGSITKHVTCFAYMLLCEQGRAGIDDPIEKHVPEIHPIAHGVTMRQLMGHTSGLRDVLSISMSVHGTSAVTTDRDLLRFYETIDDVEFAPGTSWQYSNGGYILLTAVIERISGMTLDDVLSRWIFEPLGMHDTMLRRWENGFVPNCATLHMVDRQGHFTRDYFGMEITGEGGLISTVDDMLLWLKHMDAPIVGSTETWRLMTEPHRLSNGSSTGYGLGLISMRQRGVDVVWHAGGVMGGNAQMIKLPSEGLDIAIAVNREDVRAAQLANQIIDLLVEAREEADPPETGRGNINALYISRASGRVVELSVEGGKQMMSIDGAPALAAHSDRDGVIRMTGLPRYDHIGFRPDDDSGCLTDFGNVDAMERVDSDRAVVIDDFAGCYQAPQVHAVAEIFGGAEGARLVLSGRHGTLGYRLAPMAPRIWRAYPDHVWPALVGIVTFEEEGNGLHFAADCIRPIRFARSRDSRSR